ncbi:Hydrolase FUB4 [Apiospora kogelbergensis]|uniref:Hydrolase FUB4 n=1 Tax=Apiospora kogelbergensis TaxID=1337665 RepID=A0AAW0R799_9PEZI
MRVLCLHGRGSNTEIFRMQTAAIRSFLEPEYHFEFVEGRWPHLEGNWSVHTTDFSKSKLYGFYNGLDISDILATEKELREIIAEHGPFDGILGYSQGGTLAAQLVIRYIVENPFATVQELPLKFAVFINGATPPCVLPLGEQEAYDCALAEFEEAAHLFKVFKPNDIDNVTQLRPAKLSDGRKVVTDGVHYMTRYSPEWDGQVISIPTLHVRGRGDHSDYGEGLLDLCDPDLAEDVLHIYGHDFPRGLEMSRTIAQLIRKTAAKAC